MSKYPWLDELLPLEHTGSCNRENGHHPNICDSGKTIKQSIISHIEKAKPKEYKNTELDYDINCFACSEKKQFCGDKECYQDVYEMKGYNQAIKDYENNLKGQDE